VRGNSNRGFFDTQSTYSILSDTYNWPPDFIGGLFVLVHNCHSDAGQNPSWNFINHSIALLDSSLSPEWRATYGGLHHPENPGKPPFIFFVIPDLIGNPPLLFNIDCFLWWIPAYARMTGGEKRSALARGAPRPSHHPLSEQIYIVIVSLTFGKGSRQRRAGEVKLICLCRNNVLRVTPFSYFCYTGSLWNSYINSSGI